MIDPKVPAETAGEIFSKYGVAESDLSRVIIRFAEPMLQFCQTYQAREEAVSYAIFAWNLALEPEAMRPELVTALLAQTPPERGAEIRALMDFLVRRKEDLFADNRFMIVDYRLDRQGENMHIEMTTKYLSRKQE